ncbi:MAG: rhomboid family intramembrane serine protease [Putridiphycobacter sp.]
MKITFNSSLILGFSILTVVVLILNNYLNVMNGWFTLGPTWGSGFKFYFSLIGHIFGHANMEHLLGNLSFILLLGPVIEKKYGAKLLLLMILTTAIVTAIIHIMFFSTGLLGASGVVFMLIVLTPLVDIKNNEIPLTFILVAAIFIGKEILGAFADDQISHTAHIIGGAVGAVFGFMLSKGQSPKTNSNPLDALK